MSRYPIPMLPPGAAHTAQILVKRSRFLAALAHCPNIESARAFVRERRECCPDATHNCWAFCAGPPGDTARVACHDAGEPHGSAGRPLLTMLLHCGVGEIVCVVSRWCGGTKLGISGLIHAYPEAVRAALEGLPRCPCAIQAECLIQAEYPNVDSVKRLITVHEAEILRERFTTRACFLIRLPEEQTTALAAALAGNCRDGARITCCSDTRSLFENLS